MIFRCPLCNKEFSVRNPGLVACPSCNAKVRVKDMPSQGTEWDTETQGRWVDAFISVLKTSIVDPVTFFERVAKGRGWLRPWAYALIISTAVFLIAAAYQAGFQLLAVSGELLMDYANPFAVMTMPFSALFLIIFAVVGIPLGTTLALLMQAGIYHLCLMLLGAAKRDFMSTFRVACYAMGPQFFQIVPLFGGLIGGVWQIVLTIIGLKVVHETSYGRAVLAVLLPMLLCCGIITIIGMAIAGWIFAAAFSAA